jgi:nitrate reductase gamma subunit
MFLKQIKPEQILETGYCLYGLNHLCMEEKFYGYQHMHKPLIDQIMDKMLELEGMRISMEPGLGYIFHIHVLLKLFLLMLDSLLDK